MQSQKILWLTEKKTVVLQTEKNCLKYRNSDRKRLSSAQVSCVFPKERIHLMLQVFIRRSYAAAEKLLKKQGYEADAITAHQLTGLGLTMVIIRSWQKSLESVRSRFVILSRSLRNRRVILVMRCQSQSFVQMYLR